MRILHSLVMLAVPAAAAAQKPPVVEPQTSGTTVRLQAISVASPTVAWASGIRGTYVRTLDGGKTWQPSTVPGADSLEFRDLHAWSADRAVLLASGPGDKSRIYRTADGGKSWNLVYQNQEPKAFYDCFDFQGEVGVAMSDAVAGKFPLLKTTDAGRTWQPYAPPGLENVQALEGEGAFAASGTCVILRPDGTVIFGTSTSGRVIRVGPSRTESDSTPIVRGPTAGFATLAFRWGNVGLGAGGDINKLDEFTDNVVVTRDGGKTWSLGGRPPFAGPVYGVAYVPGQRRTVIAVGPKGVAWSGDDGAAWRPVSDQEHWSLGFAANGVGWLVGPAGRITKISFE